tara:strand:+ start:287 stop:427 length:141 start_codon:yes stop_codon:yes gene_type:complete
LINFPEIAREEERVIIMFENFGGSLVMINKIENNQFLFNKANKEKR